ncbi:MAG: carbonate dehydratase, partial [Rhodospirillales bacterium]|nr:carbonate dehydratase [Acetobacter sp.]
MKIIPVTTTSDYAAIGQLFAQYIAWLGIDLAFQNYAHELATLPDYYGSSRGALFLARVDGLPAGCIGLRQFSASVG